MCMYVCFHTSYEIHTCVFISTQFWAWMNECMSSVWTSSDSVYRHLTTYMCICIGISMHTSTRARCPPTCFFCIYRQHVHMHTLPPCTIEDAVIKELAHFFPRCITDSPDLFLANYLPRLLREGVLGPGHGWDPFADACTAVHQHVEMSG